MVLPGKVGYLHSSFAIDTGANVNVLSDVSYRELKRKSRGGRYPLLPTDRNLQGVDKIPLEVLGSINLPVSLRGRSKPMELTFYVISRFGLPADGLIGLRTLKEYDFEISPRKHVVREGSVEYRAMSNPKRLLDATLYHKDTVPEVETIVSDDLVNALSEEDSSKSGMLQSTDLSHTFSNSIQNKTSDPETWEITDAVICKNLEVPPNTGMFVPIRIEDALEGTDVCIDSQSLIKGLSIEPSLNTVLGKDKGTFAFVSNVSNCNISLHKGNKLTQALIYPHHVQIQENFETTIAPVQSVTGDNVEGHGRTLSTYVKVSDYPEHTDRLLGLLNEFRQGVALPGEPLGSTQLAKHYIKLKENATPVYIPAYRLPHSQRAGVQAQIKEMLDEGVIEPSHSPWNSPLFLVPKKDSTFRPVIDFRRVNDLTEDERFPLPVLKDVLTSLGKGNQVFSTIDLLSGYWQVPLAEESRPITAFSTPQGHFQWRVMPFGLKNAPICFSRLMGQIFGDLVGKNVFVYLDDIIIFDKNVDSHFQTLTEVMKRLTQAGLKIKTSKCVFLKRSISFLGHRVDAEGIHTLDDKIKAIKNFPQPTTVENVRSFLGLCGYYRSFVKGFASIASPLNVLLKKDRPFSWGAVQEESFEKLKTALTTAPILVFPDYQRPFVLFTDASGLGLGAVLMQTDDQGKYRVIAFASRVLKGGEPNYSVTELEALAIVWALKHFRDIILGYEITCYSDHSAVQQIFAGRKLRGQLARWDLTIQEFNPRIRYIPGKANTVADSLSRNPVVGGVQFNTPTVNNFSVEDLRISQRQHQIWKRVLYYLESGDESIDLSDVLIPIDQFLINNDGILCRYWKDKKLPSVQVVIPELWVPSVLQMEHDSPFAGHPGRDRTLERIRAKYYWPTMRRDIIEHVSKCLKCAQYKGHVAKPAPILEYPPPNAPFDCIGIDLLQLTPSRQGSRYLLVTVDHFSRYTVLSPLANKTAEAVAHALITQVFLKFGPPRTILSDNGREFKNELLSEICRQFNVKQAFVKAYHPASNGLVERANRKILEALRPVVGSLGETWEDWLEHVGSCINGHSCSSTGRSPHYIIFGKELRLPYELLNAPQSPVYDAEDYCKSQFRVFSDIHREVKQCLTDSKGEMTAKQHQNAKPITFKQGDIVMLVEPERRNKLDPRFDGPFIITNELYGNSFEIYDPKSKRVLMEHADNLKKTGVDMDITLEKARDESRILLQNEFRRKTPHDTTVPPHSYNLRSRNHRG